jgi:hypothetical protein
MVTQGAWNAEKAVQIRARFNFKKPSLSKSMLRIFEQALQGFQSSFK